MDYGIRFLKQGLQVLKEVLALFLDEHLPLRWDDGQVVDAPALVLFVVLVGRGLFEDVPGSPCHHVVPRATAFTFCRQIRYAEGD